MGHVFRNNTFLRRVKISRNRSYNTGEITHNKYLLYTRSYMDQWPIIRLKRNTDERCGMITINIHAIRSSNLLIRRMFYNAGVMTPRVAIDEDESVTKTATCQPTDIFCQSNSDDSLFIESSMGSIETANYFFSLSQLSRESPRRIKPNKKHFSSPIKIARPLASVDQNLTTEN